jgi:mRNA-degrading endonuclease YafQ of YafQ-DinJ toxin-antitoxin module
MHIELHKDFKKKYEKLSIKFQDKFDERLKIFINDSFAPELNNHGLHGKYIGCRSINVTGDLRGSI